MRPLSLPRFFRRSILTAAALTPAFAFAHPGHDGDHGGGLTWDFVGEVFHRLTSPYHLAPVLAAAVLVLGACYLFSKRKKRAASRRAIPPA